MNKNVLNIFFIVFISQLSFAQSSDETFIRQIYNLELTDGKSYSMLDYLSNKIGNRLSGSPGAASAVQWSFNEMKRLGFDTVWLQPVMVPHWERGKKETGKIIGSNKKETIVNVCALGGSVGTGPNGITAPIVEVKDISMLAQLGQKNIEGKIVFFNRAMDPKQMDTFSAYVGAVDQRRSGPAEAAKLGAVAVIVRSLSVNAEDYPHTGLTVYDESVKKIPAFAISSLHADLLGNFLTQDKGLKFYLESHCVALNDVESFNVIGEIKGTQSKEDIIMVGGHLDSWDVGQGAHDDGAGCIHAIEVLRIFKELKYKPKHTIRAVMFMNEENGVRGGLEYAEVTKANNEKHVVAIESDRGGFTPRGFTISAPDAVRKKIQSWRSVLEPYGLTDFSQEGSGTDIIPLASQGIPLIGFLPDSQRYFTYHHTAEDTFDKVDKRELELGAASITALVYLIDKYDLN